MEIPLNADVYCTDGLCGRSVCILLNPVRKELTHFVVKTKGAIHSEFMVPLNYIADSTPKQIHLHMTTNELTECEPFERVEFLKVDDPSYLSIPSHEYEFGSDDFYLWPYVEADDGNWGKYVHKERIPQGELGVHRGAHVEAADGRIGRVDEFLVNSADNHITHLVLREGHLWGQKDITIPLSEIARIEKDVVHLKLTKKQVQEIPSIPIKR